MELRVSSNGPQLRVEVRTPDPELQAPLRADLGQLVSRLESEGYQTEPFVPANPVHALPTRAEWAPEVSLAETRPESILEIPAANASSRSENSPSGSDQHSYPEAPSDRWDQQRRGRSRHWREQFNVNKLKANQEEN